MFWFRLAYFARRVRRAQEADFALRQLEGMHGLPAALQRAVQSERAALEALPKLD
jgi:hypothetical protein